DPPAEESIPRNPGASRAAAENGREALAKGWLDDAEADFRRAIRADPLNATAVGGMAEVSFERARYAEALDYGRRAARLAPPAAADSGRRRRMPGGGHPFLAPPASIRQDRRPPPSLPLARRRSRGRSRSRPDRLLCGVGGFSNIAALMRCADQSFHPGPRWFL